MLFMFAKTFFKQIQLREIMTEIRIELGNYLVLALEVIIGRDIIETLLDPALEDILILVILVILRTLLAFFLNYEMTHISKKELHKVIQKQNK